MTGTINEILKRVKSTTWFKSYEKQNTKAQTAKLRSKIRQGIKEGKYKEYYPEDRVIEDDRGFITPKQKGSRLGKKAVYPKQQKESKKPKSKTPYKQAYNQREDVKEYNRQRKREAYQKKKLEKVK